jgi:thiazole/oxazole-forming peptide maturase SagD family component
MRCPSLPHPALRRRRGIVIDRTMVNARTLLLPAYGDPEGTATRRDLWRLWGPMSPVRSLMLMNPGPGIHPGHRGVLNTYDLVHVFRRLLDRASLKFDTDWFTGDGKGWSIHQAVASGLAEHLERETALWASLEQPEQPLSTYRELVDRGSAALEPTQMYLYGPEQCADPAFPYDAFDQDTPLHWRIGRRVVAGASSGEPTLVPAQICDLFPVRRSGEHRIWLSNSTGLACGRSLAHATRAALVELIERDAVSVVWFSGRQLRPLPSDPDRWCPRIARLLRAQTAVTASVRLFRCDTAVPGTEVVVAAQLDRRRSRFAFSIGCGAGVTTCEAAHAALAEYMQSNRLVEMLSGNEWWPGMEDLIDRYDLGDQPIADTISDYMACMMLYGTSTHQRFVVDWMDGTSEDAAPSCGCASAHDAALDDLLHALDAAGVTVIRVELGGWKRGGNFAPKVVRVVTPELMMLPHPSHRPLGHPRVVAAAAGVHGTEEASCRQSGALPVPMP